MSDNLERLFLRVRSEYSLPPGISPDPDGLAKVLELAARATPLETFKRTAKLVLGVLKKSTNECLRNGYIQAMSCNDVQTAQTCLNILQNKNSCAGSISQTENPSCSNISSFSAANKNPSPLQNYRLDPSVSLVRANSNLNSSNPLDVILEQEEEKARNSKVWEQADDRAKTTKLASRQTSAEKKNDERGKKHKFSYPSRQTRNVVDLSSESEQEMSPKGRIHSKPSTSGKSEADKFAKQVKSRPGFGRRLHRRSESEDSEELFRPSQSKKPSPQNKKRRVEVDYAQADSRRDKPKNRDSSDDYSPQRHLPRKADRPKNRTHRRKSTSDSEEDYGKSKFNRVFENKKRAYSKKTNKQCDSDSDIPSPAKTKVRSSKSKRRESTDSESEIDRKRPVKKRSSDLRERIHSDSDLRETSYRKDPKPRRSRSAATKSSKRERSYPSETSLSPSPSKYKRTDKNKRGKAKQNVHSDSEVAMDTSSQGKPVTKGKKTLKDSEPRSAKSQSKVTEKAGKKEPIKPVPTKGRNNAGKSNVKSTANKRKKSVETKGEEEENLPSTSKDVSQPSKSNLPSTSKDVSQPSKSNLPSTSKNVSQPSKSNLPSTSKDVSQPSKSNPLKFMSKLKELETSILNGTPDPLANKKTKNSKKSPASANKKVTASNKKTQGSAKRGKALNKKTPTKSPINKKTPTKSPINKKTTGSATQSRATKTPKPGAVKNPRKKPVTSKSASESKSTAKEKPKNIKNKGKKTAPVSQSKGTEGKVAKPKDKKTAAVSQTKGTVGKETEYKDEEENTEVDKNVNSLLSSDESFRSDSELEAPLGSLSTCLNSIKRQMPRQVGTATPPLRIFLSTNSDILSDASETSSFDRVPIKLDDKNIVKRMAKANRPKQIAQDQPTTSKPPNKLPETPEALRKMMKINKKFEEKQDSDVDCSSFSDN